MPSEFIALPKEPEIAILPLSACEHIISNMFNRPSIRHKKEDAYYHLPEDYVNMPTMKSFQCAESYYMTLFHELVHSTGHEKRLHRKTVTEMAEFGPEAYSLEELIAELGASYLAAHAGIGAGCIEIGAFYIEGWLAKLKKRPAIYYFSE